MRLERCDYCDSHRRTQYIRSALTSDDVPQMRASLFSYDGLSYNFVHKYSLARFRRASH